MNKTEQEISDKRDDAATASRKAQTAFDQIRLESIRNALDWVLGDYDGDLEL